jgi:hypothetical protein
MAGPTIQSRSSQDVEDGASLLEAGAEAVHDGIGSRGAAVIVAIDILKIIPALESPGLQLKGSNLEGGGPRRSYERRAGHVVPECAGSRGLP